jgi:DNA-binding LytR/AlgR family response regulator
VTGLTVLAVDDEAPALDEITYLLTRCPPVGDVVATCSVSEALRELNNRQYDLVLLDVRMPGLDGISLAGSISHYLEPPDVVFVSAYQEHALEAFDVGAVGYLMKPVDHERLLHLLTRIAARRAPVSGVDDPFDTIAIERGGRTFFVARSEVLWVSSAGDYVRLHTADGGSHLVRMPISMLEERWSPFGFARIHRSYLVALGSIREIRSEGARTTILVSEFELPVSRRHLRDLRERLVRQSRRVVT